MRAVASSMSITQSGELIGMRISFTRPIAFGKLLPKIRKQVRRDLKRPDLSKEKVLAALVRLLEISLIRVGNDEYAKQNQSYGLTTMLDRHAKIKGSKITFQFLGKSKQHHSITLQDAKLARIVKSCRDIPGQTLFQYIDPDRKSTSYELQAM